ncbi:MAG: hypothetical protein M3Y41_09175, partial [Pseudomonadota bacterium]|nr:hypothetical protein [Pseudomonadota bacterium]
VVVGPRVSYRESLERQSGADVLLLLQRNHPSDEGNLPGKFFEYLGARRPILLLGCETGLVAQMIRDREAGFISNVPDQIAAQLGRWLDQVPTGIPSLPPEACHCLSRTDQFIALEAFLHDLAGRADA